MSVRVMSVVWGWPLPSAEKLVALKLADCADDDGGNSYPAVLTIATVCGLTRRGAQLILRKLQKRGCIEVQSTSTPSRRATVTYRVRLEAVVRSKDDTPLGEPGRTTFAGANDVRPEPRSPGGRTTCAGGANVVRGGGERRSPDPSVIRPRSVREHTARAREDAHFTELLAIYPHKDRAVAARQAWDALNPTLELAVFIIAHVRVRLRADWQDKPRRFIPFLVNFLEERRWEEREATPAPAPASTVDWFDECKRLHNGACSERLHHHHRMLREQALSVPAVATPVAPGTPDPSRTEGLRHG